MNPSQQIEAWLRDAKARFSDDARPFVTLTYAQSLDGSIAIASGEPMALSGSESLCLTHHLRSCHDGILVGIGTVLSDDPQLNVRLCDGLDPQPIVLDSKLRMPANARLRRLRDNRRCWVLTTQSPERSQTLAASDGLEVTALASNDQGRVCLQGALRELRRKGIRSLMVEGGASVITAFLKAQLVDAVVITLVPRFVGGYKAVGDLGVGAGFPRLSPSFSGRLGEDFILWGSVNYTRAA